MYTHKHTRARIHTRTHAHTYIHTHIHARIRIYHIIISYAYTLRINSCIAIFINTIYDIRRSLIQQHNGGHNNVTSEQKLI